MKGNKLLSIIIPAYSEGENIFLIYEEVMRVRSSQHAYDWEILFVDDGSPDDTWRHIVQLCEQDSCVRGIHLSRNFGHQAALTAGMEKAKGEIIISLDADGQHPPEVIIDMLKKYEDGNHVVYARARGKEGGFLKKHVSTWYYRILSFVSPTYVPRDIGDFRLMDREVLRVFLSMHEKDRYIRGMVAWIGHSYAVVDFDVPKRIHGVSKYTWIKMWKLASDGILNFSTFPLKIGLILGVFMILLSMVFFLYVSVDFFVLGTPYPLYKWLTIMMFGVMGLQFIFMWILGEYIGRIYNETRDRPLYVVSETKNITPDYEQ